MTGIRRGRVVVAGHGEIDFSRDNIPVALCQTLYENDFPYLKITEKGKQELYGIKTVKETETVGVQTPPPNRKNNKRRSPE